jgi:hypothetical protein
MSCKNPNCKTTSNPKRIIKGGWCTANACKLVRSALVQNNATRKTIDLFASALDVELGSPLADVVEQAKAAHTAVVGLAAVATALGMEPDECSVDDIKAAVRSLVKKRKRKAVE